MDSWFPCETDVQETIEGNYLTAMLHTTKNCKEKTKDIKGKTRNLQIKLRSGIATLKLRESWNLKSFKLLHSRREYSSPSRFDPHSTRGNRC